MDYAFLIGVITFIIGLAVGFLIKKYNVDIEIERAKKRG